MISNRVKCKYASNSPPFASALTVEGPAPRSLPDFSSVSSDLLAAGDVLESVMMLESVSCDLA